MSTNGKTLKFRAAKLKGFTVDPTTPNTREGFLRKNIVVVSFFKTVLYTNILNTCTYLFH